jgi:hypothetical protein
MVPLLHLVQGIETRREKWDRLLRRTSLLMYDSSPPPIHTTPSMIPALVTRVVWKSSRLPLRWSLAVAEILFVG